MSSSVYASNKTRNILVLGKDFIQGIDDTTIYAEKMYSTNFTVANKKSFFFSLHYNGDSSYLFFNGKEIINFNPPMHKMSPRRPKHYIFGNQFYSKNAKRLRFHVFLQFNARKHMISSFYLKWIEFKRNCKYVPI